MLTLGNHQKSDPAIVGPPAPGDHLADPRTRAALRLQHHLLIAGREYLTEAGFVELLPPVIGPVTDPGVRGAKQVDVDYYGHRFKLATSGILYKQASLTAFDRIFNVAANVRLEPPEVCSTARHLVEFRQLDVELANAGREEAMHVAEGLVKHMVRRILDQHSALLEELGRDQEPLRLLVDLPFPVLPHPVAVTALHRRNYPQNPEAEIEWPAEVLLSREYDLPFFVTDYPRGSRGFYDRADEENPNVLLNFDLLAPEGFGEISSGSEREYEYAKVVTRLRETGENPAKYAWYLDMVRSGIPASAGFGIGVERLTRWIAGLEATWQATAFPKLPGVVAP
ncbi:asparagine synthetase A [Micromonospora sp. PSH03]|uniref:asparagine synthetase A n=1 Tax=Micromonospora salmantinae TaxID=2911211 RepID=UPI001EE7C153|nr:asparagine synthetase A [Micromonospora salmantinae]MCG5454692.1 asparagine synthetase A [Micromonospora salmantinae]